MRIRYKLVKDKFNTWKVLNKEGFDITALKHANEVAAAVLKMSYQIMDNHGELFFNET